jgi:23S rRNA pseudouridine1911/1915/1917 synthase
VHVVEPEAAGWRLDRWLAEPARLGSRRRAREALARGQILIDATNLSAEDGARRLQGGEQVRLWIDKPGSASQPIRRPTGPLAIVYEDEDLIVVDKPAGLLSVPLDEQPDAPSVASLVDAYWRSRGKRRALAVHRLDRDTTGLVMFARSPLARERLKAQFASRRPERIYAAVVHGAPAAAEGPWTTRIAWDARARLQRVLRAGDRHGVDALSRYRLIERFERAALLEVRLETGKQHQIRVQAWAHGCPLVGERIYTGPPAVDTPPIAFPRQALHAMRLACDHPRGGRRLAFESPLPEDMVALLVRLRRAS